MAKRGLIAYALCLFSGPLGFHHFYLGRHLQGLVWMTTGGMCGIGVIFDLFMMTDYIKAANGDPGFENVFKEVVKNQPLPSIGLHHLAAVYIIGHIWWFISQVLCLALSPFEDNEVGMALVAPLCFVLGLWVVASFGRAACSLRACLAWGMLPAAALVALEVHAGIGIVDPMFVAAAGAMYAQHQTRRWRLSKEDRPLSGMSAFVVVGVVTALFLAVAFIAIVTLIGFIEAGEGGFEFHFGEGQGWGEFFGEQMRNQIYGDGMSPREAAEVLGVEVGAEDSAITRAYRKLSLQWHPDKYSGDPAEAQEMQTKLNKAREVLREKGRHEDF